MTDAVGAPVTVVEAKRLGVPEPSGERLVEEAEMPFRNENMRRRARPAIQEFIPAADREIGLRLVELQIHGAGRMGEIPDDERALRMGRLRHKRHVLHLGAAVVHMREGDDARVGVDRLRNLTCRRETRLLAEKPRDAVDDVVVGGEVAMLREDHLPIRPHARRGDEKLEEVDRDRFGDGDLMGLGAEKRRKLRADAGGRCIPAGLVPGADEAFPPFVLDDLGNMLGDAARQGAERIAVEIDQLFVELEASPAGAKRIGSIERQAIVAGDRHLRSHEASRRFRLEVGYFKLEAMRRKGTFAQY